MWRRHAEACAFALTIALASFGAPRLAKGQSPVRVGGELQVNSYTVGDQDDPDVAIGAAGDFVVVWDSYGQDGDESAVFGRRFSSAGTALASEFQISEYTVGGQAYPKAAVDADGDFVVAWSDLFQDGGGGVSARRFNSAGVAQAAEFHVNSYFTNTQAAPAVASESDGDFVIVWISYTQDGDDWGVFGRRFDSAGAALASEFQVNVYTTDYQRATDLAMDSDGDFIVVWDSKGQDGDNRGVFARRFASSGVALATEFQVNTYTTNSQGSPAVVANAGGFVIVWSSYGQDGNQAGVFGRRFDSGGAALAAEFQVNSWTVQGQAAAEIAAGGDGDFVVTWQSGGQDGSEYGVFARRFSSAGAPLAFEFQVNTYTSTYQSLPAVAANADGDFVVAWRSYGQDDASSTGVFAQRFTVAGAAALDVDANGTTDALTDGLLVLRFLFGFTGATLTSGAVDAQNCTRCDAAAIAPYLAGLGAALDIDGDGANEALTDGLLVLRFLFGFTGATLTSGAVDTQNCTRCDAAAIAPYLQTLV